MCTVTPIRPAPTEFLIQINEAQRAALLELVRAADVDHDGHALEYWVGMLTDLPMHEGTTPDTIHGFCL